MVFDHSLPGMSDVTSSVTVHWAGVEHQTEPDGVH